MKLIKVLGTEPRQCHRCGEFRPAEQSYADHGGLGYVAVFCVPCLDAAVPGWRAPLAGPEERDALLDRIDEKLRARRDARGRQVAPDACPGCGKPTKRRPRAGKARYPHHCPHGVACPWGSPLNNHINSYPPAGGCPACRVAFWAADRITRKRRA